MSDTRHSGSTLNPAKEQQILSRGNSEAGNAPQVFFSELNSIAPVLRVPLFIQG